MGHRYRTGAGVPGSRLRFEAQQLLIRYLFAHTPVNRVEATTEIANVAEQRALEKAGFTREAYCAAPRSAKGATATM